MLKPLTFLLLFSIPRSHSNEPVYTVDRIHCNTVYDADKHPVFTQVIFEDWSRLKNTFVVREWRLNKTAWVKSPEHEAEWLVKMKKKCFDENLDFNLMKTKYRGEFAPTEWARKNYRTGFYSYTYYDNNKKLSITVRAKQFIHSHTMYDPERQNRDIWPETRRIPLKGRNSD